MTRKAIAALAGLLSAAGLGCDGSLTPDTGISYMYSGLSTGDTGEIVGADPVSGRTTTLLTFPYAGDDLLGAFLFDGTTAYFSDQIDGTPGLTTTIAAIRSIGLVGGMPTTLVTGLDAVHAIAVDSANIYFTDFFVDANLDYATSVSFIGQAPRAGGAFVKLVDNIPGEVEGIAVGGGFVYWSSATDGTISRVAIAGGDTTVLATGQGTIYRLAADDSGVYWVNDGATLVNCNFTDASVESVPNGASAPVTVVGGLENLSEVVVSAGTVYFTMSGAEACTTPSQPTQNGSVVEVPPGGSPITLAGGLGGPFDLFVAGGMVDYTSSSVPHYVASISN